MTEGVNGECMSLVKEALEAIQLGKSGCVSLAVRKLELCANLLDDKRLKKWCEFHLGIYAAHLPLHEKGQDGNEYVETLKAKVYELKLPVNGNELTPRTEVSGGGFESIEFIERVKEKLDKQKKGNDGTHYIINIQKTISATSNSAYSQAAQLYKTLSFGEIPSRQFNVIRDRVDNLLLDICPEAIEKFMVAYERLSSSSSENWSQALTAVRRVIKSVADSIYPPRETGKGERKLGEEQYINRLWAYLDENAEAGSDKDLAKAHVNYLGAFIQRLNDKASKGVHAEVTYNEAVRAVLYTYLTLGDILEHTGSVATKLKASTGKINLNDAKIEELIEIPGINEELAKKIVKRRVSKPFSTIDDLAEFNGIGARTLEKIKSKAFAG